MSVLSFLFLNYFASPIGGEAISLLDVCSIADFNSKPVRTILEDRWYPAVYKNCSRFQPNGWGALIDFYPKFLWSILFFLTKLCIFSVPVVNLLVDGSLMSPDEASLIRSKVVVFCALFNLHLLAVPDKDFYSGELSMLWLVWYERERERVGEKSLIAIHGKHPENIGIGYRIARYSPWSHRENIVYNYAQMEPVIPLYISIRCVAL